MKFLLVNVNAAVKKIFSIAARKASIQLDIVGSIEQISLQEDYNCIFIDDGVLNTGNFTDLKNKMITTKFCLILSKDKAPINGFDNYIKKPFLPTDIYEVLKKEKYNEINFSSYDDNNTNTLDIKINSNTQNNKSLNETLQPTNVADIDIENINNKNTINVDDNFNNQINHINNIDLSEFSDSNDEFLSGIKDNLQEQNQFKNEHNQEQFQESISKINLNENYNDEVTLTYEEEDEFNNAFNLVEDDTIEQQPITQEISLAEIEPMIEPTQKVEQKEEADISLKKDLNIAESKPEIQINDTMLDENILHDNKESLHNNDFMHHQEDDIDFNSIFAIQDEFLQAQKKDKPKGLIGGDISRKKEEIEENKKSHSQNEKSTNIEKSQNPNIPNSQVKLNKQTQTKTQNIEIEQNTESMVEIKKPEQNPTNHIEESKNNFDDFKDSENINFNDNLNIINNNQNDFTNNNFEQYNFDDFNAQSNTTQNTLNENEQGNIDNNFTNSHQTKNINDLSDEELDELDDEELLKLQEDSLNNNDSQQFQFEDNFLSKTAPKILNKNDIDELTNILENKNQNINNINQNNLKIQNNELGSITQEALSEVLDEENINNDFDFGNNNFMNEENNLNQSFNQYSQNMQNQNIQNLQNPTNMEINAGDLKSNTNVDLLEIIKSFPIDKLRELLSGVQITINITFPNKKQ